MHSLYIVSGGTGASAEQIVRTVLAQFPRSDICIRIKADVRYADQVDEVVAEAEAAGGILVHTLVSDSVRLHLAQSARSRNVSHIDLLGDLLGQLTLLLGQKPAGEPGRYRRLRSEYFARIDAIEYAVDHDDGRNTNDWGAADVVLVGLSRTGKTPLSMYLAMHGWKAANLPLLREPPPPPELFELPQRKVIGLTIRTDRLQEYRGWRAKDLGLRPDTSYSNPDDLDVEVATARQVFRRIGCATVDVTDKPIEEVAREAMKLVRP